MRIRTRHLNIWIRRAGTALCLLLMVCVGLLAPTPAQAITCAFKNPLLPLGQDPSVVYQDGYYYLVQSTATGIVIRKSTQLTALGSAPSVTVFVPPGGEPYSADIWAPELLTINGEWYIYFAADDNPGNNKAHRIYVLKSDTPDPMGKWSFKGNVYQDAATDKWAIDASVFTYKDRLYIIWSGWPGDVGDFPQNLYIATMSDPLTVSGVRHQIATPDQSWEKSVQPIEEGPEPFIRNGQLSIVYSADASWTSAYKLGMLKLTGSDPLEAASWTKSGPVFSNVKSGNEGIFGPGHNSAPVKSPDGSQDWLIYHAMPIETGGWNDRQIRAQPFTWNADNTPNLGQPRLTAVPVPSGEPCGLTSHLPLDGNVRIQTQNATAQTAKVVGTPAWTSGKLGGALALNGTSDYLDLNEHKLNTMGSYSVAAWVQLANTTNTSTIVSQEGGISSEFALQFTVEAGGKFAFTMFGPFGGVNVQAVSRVAPTTGEWYHLVGVRDLVSQQVQLYINGKLEGSAGYNADWLANGHTIVGAGKQKTKRTDFFGGKIDDIRLYNGALNALEIDSLYRTDSNFLKKK